MGKRHHPIERTKPITRTESAATPQRTSSIPSSFSRFLHSCRTSYHHTYPDVYQPINNSYQIYTQNNSFSFQSKNKQTLVKSNKITSKHPQSSIIDSSSTFQFCQHYPISQLLLNISIILYCINTTHTHTSSKAT